MNAPMRLPRIPRIVLVLAVFVLALLLSGGGTIAAASLDTGKPKPTKSGLGVQPPTDCLFMAPNAVNVTGSNIVSIGGNLRNGCSAAMSSENERFTFTSSCPYGQPIPSSANYPCRECCRRVRSSVICMAGHSYAQSA